MTSRDFDPKIHAIAQKITREVFGDPNKKEEPKVHSDIPVWSEELLNVTRRDVNRNQYFTYPGIIDWELVPEISIRGTRLFSAKKAMEKLSARVDALKNAGYYYPEPSSFASLSYATASKKGRHWVSRPDLIWGFFQERTFARFNRSLDKNVGLKGSALISLWKRFGIDIIATWPNQVDSDPGAGAPMNAYGSAIRDQYSNWTPGPWEWHKNEYLVPNKTYYAFRFPVVNIRLLFHIIQRYKLVFTRPYPVFKRVS